MGVFSEGIEKSNERAKRNMHLIFFDAVQTTFTQATRRQPSVKETGGSFEVGKVPVDTGFLIGTSEFRINGAMVSSGVTAIKTAEGSTIDNSTPPDIGAGLLQAKIEDAVSIVFTAPYSRRIEYGFHGQDSKGRSYSVSGRLYITTAAANWPDNVQESIRKFS